MSEKLETGLKDIETESITQPLKATQIIVRLYQVGYCAGLTLLQYSS